MDTCGFILRLFWRSFDRFREYACCTSVCMGCVFFSSLLFLLCVSLLPLLIRLLGVLLLLWLLRLSVFVHFSLVSLYSRSFVCISELLCFVSFYYIMFWSLYFAFLSNISFFFCWKKDKNQIKLPMILLNTSIYFWITLSFRLSS